MGGDKDVPTPGKTREKHIFSTSPLDSRAVCPYIYIIAHHTRETMNRFVITLDVEDRELINELANRDEKMERVREQLMAKSEQSWNSDESDTFLISLPNLERYLSIVHNVYITQA